MSWWWRIVLPLGVLCLTLATGWMANGLARRRHRPGAPSRLWERITFASTAILGLPLFCTALARPFLPESFWRSGWHPYADLTGVAGLSVRTTYVLTLLAPWAIWATALAWGLFGNQRPMEERPGGLAGLGGLRPSRRWILLLALPLAVLAIAAWSRLGGGPEAYPASAWTSLVIVTLSLAYLAFTPVKRPEAPDRIARESGPTGASQRVESWPMVLAAQGIHLQTILDEPRSAEPRQVRGSGALELRDHLISLGARGIAPEMIEATADLLMGGKEPGRPHREILVLAPDDCGQEETLAVTVDLMARRYLQSSLVVVPRDAESLAERLTHWAQDKDKVQVVQAGRELDPSAWIQVVEAGILSDHLLPRWADTASLSSLGLLVWWNLQEYSGVAGANLWAVSRRLYRLVKRRGRSDLRTLALARSASRGGAQIQRFIHRLLPRRFDHVVHVPLHFPRGAQVHLLGWDPGATRDLDPASGLQRLPLRATRASVEGGWPTHLGFVEGIDRMERQRLLQTSLGDTVLEDQLISRRAEGSAVIASLTPGEVLALPEVASHGARAGNADLEHHLGIASPMDPYSRHALSEMGSKGGPTTSKRLVCAEGHPSIVRRHLRLALEEASGTLTELLHDFLLEEELTRTTLEELAGDGKLDRVQVRYLDANGELERSYRFTSRRPESRSRRPLDTVGTELVAVCHPGQAGDASGGILFHLDPERLPILAYPQRIFLHDGRRYRIRDWDPARLDRQGWVECLEENQASFTWRRRDSFFQDLRPAAPPADLSRHGRMLTRQLVDGRYRERVSGVIEESWDSASRETGVGEDSRKTLRLDPITTTFETRALLLRLSQPEDTLALLSLAQALRHVLPVHLGVLPDDLEVVLVGADELSGSNGAALAVVDLYPGGVGLLDAIADDDSFLLEILDRARSWLGQCPCQTEAGCQSCLRSPAAHAANVDQLPYRSAAVDLLQKRLP